MKYVKQQITEFLATNITQLYSDYNPLTTYIYQDETALTSASVVRYGSYYYRSLVNSNIGNNPEETENKQWVRWKVDNTHALIDEKALTKTVVSDQDIVVEVLRGSIDTLCIGYFSASMVKVEHFNSLGVLMGDFTQIFKYSVNEEVFDLWSYIYSSYTNSVDRSIKIDIPPIGYKLKITISKYGNQAVCGFLIGGTAVYMGITTDNIGFNFNSFSTVTNDIFGNTTITKRSVQDALDFETVLKDDEKRLVPKLRREIKQIYDDIVVFIVDDSSDSFLENAITLGKIENASVVASIDNSIVMTWSITESI